MRISIFAIATFALLLAPIGAPAEMQQTVGSNVLVTRCDPQPYNNAAQPPFVVTPYKTGHRAILAMGYENESPVAATEIVFGLVSSGKLVAVGKDFGDFSKDVPIGRNIMLSQEIFPLGTQTHCVVLEVRYRSGTMWLDPDPPSF
jgi:hypothetical protein